MLSSITNTTLLLDSIDNNFETTKILQLKENNYIYLFTISEINKIIYNSLTYSYDFIIDCQDIKNPYTNLPFSLKNFHLPCISPSL